MKTENIVHGLIRNFMLLITTSVSVSWDRYLQAYKAIIAAGGTDLQMIQAGLNRVLVATLHAVSIGILHPKALLLPSNLYGRLKKMVLAQQETIIVTGTYSIISDAIVKYGDMKPFERQVIFDNGKIRTRDEQERYITTMAARPVWEIRNGTLYANKKCQIPLMDIQGTIVERMIRAEAS